MTQEIRDKIKSFNTQYNISLMEIVSVHAEYGTGEGKSSADYIHNQSDNIQLLTKLCVEFDKYILNGKLLKFLVKNDMIDLYISEMHFAVNRKNIHYNYLMWYSGKKDASPIDIISKYIEQHTKLIARKLTNCIGSWAEFVKKCPKSIELVSMIHQVGDRNLQAEELVKIFTSLPVQDILVAIGVFEV